ncbi:peptidoglycan DD-metalloendopeptidase family protein [Streptomyces sp. NPDC058953]|uniref:peptidoglycan DD-metalloendopeptidase family protein n=1 Tax=unclassified Streptomyces TaxID=2593676 RepID=UPI0036B4B2A3
MPSTTTTVLALIPALLSPSVTTGSGPLSTTSPSPPSAAAPASVPPTTPTPSGTGAAVTRGDDRRWPVPRPRILRGWDPPASPYGPGHRGVDLAAPPDTPVRAPGPGRIHFAGRIAGRGVLSLTLDGTGTPPLRVTYEPVDALLPTGTGVTAGTPVARLSAAPRHCPVSCLHWGLLRGTEYLNPLSLVRRPHSRLLPLAPPRHDRPPTTRGDPATP